ncbi:DUF2293 domain-containing protein [Halosquirtibacter xylanolyticus]|uniref:DUF2293 domain-containing protein n=1 Tax=Halosquirtibacter xylanolyticus TaxID=3374599 RepID=UPI003749C56C|nr:DUF2293 domain-containing protein [Prolixibacteraceae bacterium]
MELDVVMSTGEKLLDKQGQEVSVPPQWVFLPAGDAGVTRAITKHKNYIRVKVLRGRRAISKGIWAPEALILEAKQRMEAMRSSESYQKQNLQRGIRRDQKQEVFKGALESAIKDKLSFHLCYKELEFKLAKAIADHSAPIGSGTVARSSRLTMEQKAERAINGWVRHHLTPYDQLKIARVKGARSMARKIMIEKGNEVLDIYRIGQERPSPCPIQKSLESIMSN